MEIGVAFKKDRKPGKVNLTYSRLYMFKPPTYSTSVALH